MGFRPLRKRRKTGGEGVAPKAKVPAKASKASAIGIEDLLAAKKAIETLGGCLLLSEDGRIRVDQTFEGRLTRLRARVQQVILERLLPGGLDTGNLFSG